MVQKVAGVISTAASSAANYGWGATGQFLLAPATSDVYDKGQITTGEDGKSFTNWENFTIGVLNELRARSFAPTVYVGWSHHNYYDVKYPVTSSWRRASAYPGATSRAQVVQQQLGTRSWAGGDHRLWLTEGGYQKVALVGFEYQTEAQKLGAAFDRIRSTTGVYMFTQHVILNLDSGSDTFLSGVGSCTVDTTGKVVVRYQDDTTAADSGEAYDGSWLVWKNKPGSATK